MELLTQIDLLRRGESANFPKDADSLAFARKLDSQDALKDLRNEFIIPTDESLAKTKLGLDGNIPSETSSKECVYLVSHGQGLQPKAVRHYLNAQLETWASIAVHGHYTDVANSPLRQWQDMAEECSIKFASILGCLPHEVTIMNGLSVNLHLMMASFYKPTRQRHKIIVEWSPFPSDQHIVESQVMWHGLYEPSQSIVRIPPNDDICTFSTETILSVIDQHAEETALLLLPGVHFYSSQLFYIPTISAHAKKHGITVGWDLAHAVGNVELRLHDWDVDFACWCNYKYINSGPGSLGGAFVHQRHGSVDFDADRDHVYRARLSGWYGNEKSTRYSTNRRFKPTLGAAGYQVSNPSVMDLATLSAALTVFDKTSMRCLRSKSLVLTAYTEYLLDQILAETKCDEPVFILVTPRDPLQRGAQTSLRFRDKVTLDGVMEALEDEGIVCDRHRPDLMRISAAPLYSRFEDVWRFASALRDSLGLPRLPVSSDLVDLDGST